MSEYVISIPPSGSIVQNLFVIVLVFITVLIKT